MDEDLLEEWKKLSKQIKKYNKMYEYGEPLVPDNTYDELRLRLQYLENIIGRQKNSPLNVVGAEPEKDKKVKHTNPVLSLDHGFGEDAILSFIKKIQNSIENPFPIVAEHKIDGISLILRYQNDSLQIITRGNGEYGNDVTEQMKYLNIPKQIKGYDFLEVRGEMYMKFDDFSHIQHTFSSPRNACASLIQNKKAVPDMKINFIAHNCIGIEVEHYSEQMMILKSLGFEIFEESMCLSQNDCIDFFTNIKETRHTIPYPIDGVVFKLNNLAYWQILGSHRTAPKYAFAVKFDPLFKSTTITDIQIQIGKFGTITPVAVFQTIEIDGQNISKASLHNIDELYAKEYGIGDHIVVSRAGDTIPYVKEKTYNAENCFVVQNCPCCDSVLVKSEKTLRCPNGWNCEEQQILRIAHFCSRNAFNIEGLGEQIVREFVENGFIKYPCDIFLLPQKINSGEINLLNKQGWQKKSIDNLVKNINKSRQVSLSNFLFGLCIPNVGNGNANIMAKAFTTFENFVHNYKSSEPKQIPGVGETIMQSIKKFISEELWIYNLSKEVVFKE